MFVACDYATAAEMYKLALSHWTKCAWFLVCCGWGVV